MRTKLMSVGLALVAGIVLAVALSQTAGGPAAATAASSAGGTIPSGIVITCGPDAQNNGSDTCTATVGGTSGTPTGQVNFVLDPGARGTLSAPACGLPAAQSSPPPETESCSVDYSPAPGTGVQVPIVATYYGDATYAPSSGSPSAVIVTGAATPTAGWTPASGTEGGYSGTSALPEFNLLNLPTGTDSGGHAQSITSMDMTNGVFSGTAYVAPFDFTDTGVENGDYQIFELSESTYTATDTDELFILPNGDLGEAGEFDAGKYASDLGTVPGRISANEDLACTPVGGTDTFTCTETVSGGGGTPTGNATFTDVNGGTFSPTNACVLSAGACSVTYTPADGGDDSGGVAAVYSGDPTYTWTQASVAGGGTNTTPAASGTSATQVTCNDVMPGQAGDYDQCTATVGGSDSANAAAVPTGSVTFTVNPGGTGAFPDGPTCTLTPSQSGDTAYCSVEYSPPASLGTEPPIIATYSGDANFASSSGSPQLEGTPDTDTETDTTPTATTDSDTTTTPTGTTVMTSPTTTTTPEPCPEDDLRRVRPHATIGSCPSGIPVGTVAAIRGTGAGDVYILHADGTETKATEGAQVYPGDTIVCTGTAATAVDFYLGGAAGVTSAASITVADERHAITNSDGSLLTIAQQKAQIWSGVSHQKGTMQIQTNAGVMGIKG